MKKNTTLEELIRPAVEALSLELWGLEYRLQGNRGLLRIYIEKAGGIDVDDCAKVSHQVSGIMDVEDPINEEYTLEVSSPGADRPLYTEEQFKQYVDHQVKIKLRRAFDGRRNYKGTLKAAGEGLVVIQVDDYQYDLPMDSIERANVVPTY